MPGMGLQGPLRFAAIRLINSIESIEVEEIETGKAVEPAVRQTAVGAPVRGPQKTIEGGRP